MKEQMKTLKDLTPEIKAKIPQYQEICLNGIVNDVEFPVENTIKYIHKIYELAGYEKPLVIQANGIIEYFILYNIIFNENSNSLRSSLSSSLHDSLYNSLRSSLESSLRSSLYISLDNSLRSSLNSSLRSSLDSSLESSLSSSLYSSLDDSLYNSLDSSLNSSLDDSLYSSLYNSLRSSLESSLSSSLDDSLYNSLDSSLNSSLESSLYSSLNSSLRSSLRSSLNSSLCSSLYSSLDDSLESSLYSSLNSSLRSSLRSSLNSSLCSSLDSSLRSSLESSLYSSLDDSLCNSLDSPLNSSLYSSLYSSLDDSLYNSLDSSLNSSLESLNAKSSWAWYCSIYSRVHFTWYKFIQDEFNIEHDLKDTLNELYNLIINSDISRCWFTEKVVLVLKTPKNVKFQNNVLHSINEASYSYLGIDKYFIRGVEIDKNIWDKLENNTYTFEDFVKEKNEEIKNCVLAYIEEKRGSAALFDFISSNLKEVGTYVDKKEEKYLEGTTKGMNIGVYTLFKGNVNDVDLAFIRCYCPSTDRMFFLGVEPKYNNPKDAIASLYRIPKKLKNDIKYIQRQGERYTTILKDESLYDSLSIEDAKDLVIISGDEYFNLLRYEY